MSKLKKILATSLLVVVSGFSYLGGAIGNIAKSLFSVGTASAASFKAGNKNTDNATEVKQGNALSVTGLQTSVKLGEPVSIKFGEASDNNVTAKGVTLTKSNLFIEILDPYGASLTKWNETSMEVVDATQVTLTDTTLTLTPKTSGNYTIRFHHNSNDVWTSTGNYTVEVSSSAYQMEMATNDTIPMPVSFKTGVSGKESQKISLPLLYNENGELIEKTNVLLTYGTNKYIVNYTTLKDVKLTDVLDIEGLPTVNTYAEYKTYTIKKAPETLTVGSDYKYILNLAIDTTGDSVDVAFNSNVGDTAVNYEKYATTFNVQKGKNVLTYTLKDSSGETELARYTHTITGSDQYESENISLKVLASKTLSSLDYQTRVYLPEVDVTNTNNKEEDLASFYYYVVKDSAKKTDNVKLGRDENGFWFEPLGEVGTSYTFEYNAIDAFGNSGADKRADGTYEQADDFGKVVTVVDNKFDDYAITSSYDMADFGKSEVEEKADASYLIPSKIKAGEELTIPALWAYDKSGIKSAYVQLSTSSSTLKSTKTDGTKENVSGTFGMITSGGATEKPSSLLLPLNDDTTENTEDRHTLSEYVTFKNGKNYYYEEASSRGTDAIGNIRICTTNSTRNANDKYLYFYAKIKDTNNYSYYKLNSDSASVPTTKDGEAFVIESTDIGEGQKYTEVGLEEIRNFKLSCETVLTLDSKIFGAGTYKLTYYAYDNNSGRIGGSKVEYSFEVVEVSLDATTPTVTFGDNTVSNVGEGQDIAISAPTITDSTDSRLFVRYYAVVDANFALISEGLASETKIEFNTNMTIGGSTLYALAKASKSFKVVALAYNHFAKTEKTYADWASLSDEDKKGIGFAELEISVKNGDTVAPLFDKLSTTSNKPVQNASYTVQGATFYDNSDDAKIKVEITDTDGRIYTDYSVGALKVTADNTQNGYTHKYEFGGVTFTPTNADKDKYYTVTYKLVDKSDNVTAISFVLVHVEDKTPPVITLKTESRTVELGQTLDITFKSEDASATTIVNTVTCTDANGKTHNFASVKGNTIHFEGEKVGTYTLALTSADGETDSANKSTREFTIEVKDTLTPTISVKNSSGSELVFVSNQLELPAIKESEMYSDTAKTTPATITIPTATVADSKPENALNTVEFGATGRITITTPNSNDGVSEFVYDLDGNPIGSNTNPLKLTRKGNTFEFTPFGTSFRGEYKIVYSATDNNGNSATSKTITISVGDSEKPNIYLTQAFEDVLSKGFILGKSDTLEINPKAKIKENTTDYSDVDLYVSDNLGFVYKEDGSIDKSADKTVTVNFYITDPSGSTLTKETNTESSKTTYKFTTAGTYTITFYITDAAGNRSQNVTRKFVVKAKTTTSVDTSTIVGTVLIVISALILAGIIVYLVRGVKLLPKKNKKTSKKADKKTDNKVEE